MRKFVLLIAVCLSCCTPPKEGEKQNTFESEGKKEVETPWKYKEGKDEMSGDLSYFAFVNSTNQVEFEFPYQGGSTFMFALRNTKGVNSASFGVSKGQFMPSIMGSEHIRIKFDDGELMQVSYLMPDNGKMDVVLFEVNFIDKLKKAKKMMIEAPFFQAGRVIAKFDVEGLQWNK